jgi:hypothetical protein
MSGQSKLKTRAMWTLVHKRINKCTSYPNASMIKKKRGGEISPSRPLEYT